LGFVSTGGDALLLNSKINITAGSVTNFGIYLHTAGSTVVVEGGEITAGSIVTAHASAVVRLQGSRLGSVTFDTSGGGVIRGTYYDSNNVLWSIDTSLSPIPAVVVSSPRPNPIINADFLHWPRGTTITSPATGAYTATLWQYAKVGAMVHTVSQSSDVPTVAQAGYKIPYSALIDCTTLDSSIAAGDFCTYSHAIEGYNFLDLAQRQFTLGFWVKATKTGTYCVAFRNSVADRSWVAEFVVNTTATWEYKTITVDASPSAGTWNYTTGVGLFISFTLAGGSTFQTTAGAWQTGNFFSTSSQVNGCDSASNDFRIAGLRIAPGPGLPSPRVPDIEQELERCYRYAFAMDASDPLSDQGYGRKAGVNVQITDSLPVPMRAIPTLSHNISGYTPTTPTTTTIAILDLSGNAFLTIAGSLTVSLSSASLTKYRIIYTAGTSWSGATGDICVARLGPDVVAVLSAEF
jgi:hypothetical protein